MNRFARAKSTQNIGYTRLGSAVNRFLSGDIGSPRPGVMQRVWLQYLGHLERRPLLTKSVTCGVLSFGADVVCQVAFPLPIVKKNSSNDSNVDSTIQQNKIDWFRVAKFTLLGVFYVSPSLHVWYGVLARTFPGAGMTGTMQRLACDQLLFAPAFIAGFFSLALVIDGRPEGIYDKLRVDWLPTMRANLSLWVPSMFINFRYVPPQLQVLFSNCVGFFWNIYLSWATNKTLKEPEPEK